MAHRTERRGGKKTRSDGKSCYQRFLEQLAVQPDQLEAALHKSEDQVAQMLKEAGVEQVSPAQALEDMAQVQRAMVGEKDLEQVAGGVILNIVGGANRPFLII